MNIIHFFLEFLIIFSIFASLTVITSTNPVIAIIYLIGVFLSAAIYLIFIGLNFIGISYIIVYIGAITVLFLFVIMSLNIDLLDIIETDSQYSKNIPLILSISVLFAFVLFNVIPFNEVSFLPTTGNIIANLNNYLFGSSDLLIATEFTSIKPLVVEQNLVNVIQIEVVGQSLYTDYGIPLILSTMILLLALTAPILLTLKKVSSK